MGKADIWLVPTTGGRCALRLELSTTPFISYPSVAAGLRAGRALAKETSCVLVILDDDSRFKSRESFVGLPSR